MLNVFAFENGLMLVATLALFGVKAWAFVDALSHSQEAYVAAGKMTKKAWLVILGIFLAAHMIFWSSGPIGLLSIIGTVAALVYIVDVRPALRSLTRR
ncbi:MAG: DUF2516 family protein [Nocardioidaceae bacterium]